MLLNHLSFLKNVQVCFYSSTNSFTNNISSRIMEIAGVYHCKFMVFDSEVLITGYAIDLFEVLT